MSAKRVPKASKELKRPILVREGSAVVKIYRSLVKVDGKPYEQFTVAYYLGSKRIRQRFSDFAKAKSEAEAAAIKISNGETEALKLTGTDRAVYVQCVETSRRIGKALSLVVEEYAEAAAMLPSGISIREAVREYVRRSAQVRSDRSVPDLVKEFISAK